MYALASAFVGACVCVYLFRDVRAAVAGAAASAAFAYLAWRPGGFGWQIDARLVQLLESGSGAGVRWAWLLRAALIVAAVVLVLSLLAALASS
ncbi:MAG: hypothetical protein ABIP03_15620 [Aquihabitans sp.]